MNVLLVDDDHVSLTIAKAALSEIAETIAAYTDARAALEEDLDKFDVIISDYHMPLMRGDEFLSAVRERVSRVPFAFLTINDSTGVAVELIRLGADDYIQKPIEPTDFRYRVEKLIRDKKRELRIEQIEQERRLLDLEKRKLINWRILYASKDSRQTDRLVAHLARNINQGGGFLWLDLLKSSIRELDDANYSVPKEIMDMSVTSAENSRRLLELTEFIGRIESMELEIERMSVIDLFERVETFVKETLAPITERYDRWIELGVPPTIEGEVSVEFERLSEILRELVANAIKYSPPDTPIRIDYEAIERADRAYISVRVNNVARDLQEKDETGDPIIGIPYDYQELVFDLFFTIEAFPEYIDDESWTDGAGLNIARKLIRRMNGDISVHSGVDYTSDPPRLVVRMDVAIPMERSKDG